MAGGLSSLPSYTSVESKGKTSPLFHRCMINCIDCIVSNGVVCIVGIKVNCVEVNASALSWMY